MILHILEAVAVVSVISAPTWFIFRSAKTKFPVNGHCWHAVNPYDPDPTLVQCCYCGIEFDALDKIGAPGHGQHAPKTSYPFPPQGPCPKRPVAE